MQLKKDIKLANEQAKFKKKCKFCGHTLTFYHFEKDKKICSWCGHYNYKNENAEFKFLLNKKRKELVNE